MSTITREFTKEQLQQIEAAAKEVMWPVVWSEKKAREHFSEKITPKVVLKLARIALASLEAEPAIHRWRRVTVEPYGPYPWHYGNFIGFSKPVEGIEDEYFYSAPAAPVSVPDDVMAAMQKVARIRLDLNDFDGDKRGILDCLGDAEEALIEVVNRRAAMLQSFGNSEQLEPVTTTYKLPGDFDFERFNDVTWLECVASNPHMHSPTTSTIAMVALELNKRLEAGNSPVIQDGSEDTKRLDWLDAQNKRLNEYYGTTYGWKFDANFQRNAMMLNDSNYPVMTVRQAIDEAISAAPQQEVKP